MADDKKLSLTLVLGAVATGLEAGLSKAGAAVDRFRAGAIKHLDAISAASTKLGLGFTAAGAAISGALVMSAKSAGEVENAMQRVRVMLQGRATPEQLVAIETGVQRVSRAFNTDLIPTIGAAASALGDVAPEDLVPFMEKAAAVSKAAGVSIEDSVGFMTNAMDAFNLSVEEAGKAADAFFAVQKKDGPTIAETATLLGKAGPALGMLGIKYEEVAAAMGAISDAGIPARQSASAMDEIMRAIVEPTDDVRAAFKALGVEVSEEAIKSRGFSAVFTDVLQAVDRARNGPPLQLVDKKGNVEAITGTEAAFRAFGSSSKAVLAMAENGAERFTSKLQAAADATGSVKSAFDMLMGSPMETLSSLQGEAEGLVNVIGKQVLEAIQPAAAALTLFVGKITAWMENNPALAKTIVAVAGALGLFLTVVGGVLLGIAALAAVLSALATVSFPLILGIAALLAPVILAVGMAFGVILAHGEAFSAWAEEHLPALRETFMGVVQQVWASLQQAWAAIKPALQELGASILMFASTVFPHLLAGAKSAVNWIANVGIPAVVQAVQWLLGLVTRIITFIADNWPSIQRMLKAGLEILIEVLGVVWEALKKVGELIGWLFENVGGGWEGASSKLETFASMLEGLVGVVQWLGNAFTVVFDTIIGSVETVIGLFEKLTGAIKSAGSFLGELPGFGGAAMDWVKDAAGSLPGFASGGVFTAPAGLAQLHGPEAVIPLSSGAVPVRIESPAGAGVGGPVTINVHAAPGMSAEQIAHEVMRVFGRRRG